MPACRLPRHHHRPRNLPAAPQLTCRRAFTEETPTPCPLLDLLTPARALTVHQPWASAIADGFKPIENRLQNYTHRGTLLIHAGIRWSFWGAIDPRVQGAYGITDPRAALDADEFPHGQIIAVAQLVDVHRDEGECCRPWGESRYTEVSGRRRSEVHHLVLDQVVKLPVPVKARGYQSLWLPQPEALAAVQASLELAA